MLRNWYMLLDKICIKDVGAKAAFKKVAIDQVKSSLIYLKLQYNDSMCFKRAHYILVCFFLGFYGSSIHVNVPLKHATLHKSISQSNKTKASTRLHACPQKQLQSTRVLLLALNLTFFCILKLVVFYFTALACSPTHQLLFRSSKLQVCGRFLKYLSC